MALNKEQFIQKVETKLEEIENEELEDETANRKKFAELFWLVLQELKDSATVTGVCGGAGSPLTNGKIT